MKTSLGGCAVVLTLFWWLAIGTESVLAQATVARLEQERRNDNHAWQIMRQMLVDFGYSDKVAGLDAAWEKTTTPQQWAAVKHNQPAVPDLTSPETERILAHLPLQPPLGFSRFFTDACARGGDLREIVRVLVAWTARGGQAELQGRGNWTIHFIYGAACELNLGLGYFAAVMKETFDQANGSVFSFDDMAASMAGAEWVHQVERDPHWLAEWKSGRLTLARNLPVLHYGHGDYSTQVAEKVRADILTAYNVRDETPRSDKFLAIMFQR